MWEARHPQREFKSTSTMWQHSGVTWTMAISDDHWHGRNAMDSILLTLR
jgi:hypothetical protein